MEGITGGREVVLNLIISTINHIILEDTRFFLYKKEYEYHIESLKYYNDLHSLILV